MIPFAIYSLIPAIEGPNTWGAVVSLLVGCLALAGALWKAARALIRLDAQVSVLTVALEDEIERRENTEKEAREERKEQAKQFVEIRRQIDRLVWSRENDEAGKHDQPGFKPRGGG